MRWNLYPRLMKKKHYTPGEKRTSAAARKLFTKIRELGVDLPEDAFIERQHIGRHQRSEGSFTGYITAPKLAWGVGTFWPINRLLKCKNLFIGQQRGDDYIHCGCKPGEDCNIGREL